MNRINSRAPSGFLTMISVGTDPAAGAVGFPKPVAFATAAVNFEIASSTGRRASVPGSDLAERIGGGSTVKGVCGEGGTGTAVAVAFSRIFDVTRSNRACAVL